MEKLRENCRELACLPHGCRLWCTSNPQGNGSFPSWTGSLSFEKWHMYLCFHNYYKYQNNISYLNFYLPHYTENWTFFQIRVSFQNSELNNVCIRENNKFTVFNTSWDIIGKWITYLWEWWLVFILLIVWEDLYVVQCLF
jgi:hypothetical protein